MIQLSGMPFKENNMWQSNSIENKIVQQIDKDSVIHSYQSMEELLFELKLRKNIILSAKAMSQGDARFGIFSTSRCNPRYWHLTNAGGFQLRHDVLPSNAIQDIFQNSSLYVFECATANVIIFYHAILNSIGKYLFNQLFQNIYLYSWHVNPNLGIDRVYTNHALPGDVVYFDNPDADPRKPWWRGENAVVLENSTYFGHGLGIRTFQQMIQVLNEKRRQGSHYSAYLTDLVVRPSFKHLMEISMLLRGYMTDNIDHIVTHHNKSSISYDQYLVYLNKEYSKMFKGFL